MIDNYLLEYLVAFAKAGTLTTAAQQLNVSPASVSRGLTKLKKMLNVKLFDHQPQRLILTPTGKFTAEQAASLLDAINDFPRKVQDYATQEQAIQIGGTIPGPLLLLRHFYAGKEQLDFKLAMLPPNDLAERLLNNQATLIITTHPSHTPRIEAEFVGEESLAIKVTKLSEFYHQRHVSFAELNHHRFVVAPNIGEWKAVIEHNIPNAHFLYQMETSSVHELTKNSIFPLFRTNITHYLESFNPIDQQRNYIPISDASARLSIYALYQKKDRERVEPLIKWLQAKLNAIK